MRRSLGLITMVIGTSLLVAGNMNADEPQGRVLKSNPKQEVKKTDESPEATSVVKVRTQEQIDVSPEERQRAAVAAQAATAEEQQVAARLRGLQTLMQKEEQLLAQRLAYAAKVREQGLAKNDQKLLDQAELIERQSLDYYQKRCKQFENVTVTTSSSSSKASKPTPASSPRSATPSTRSSSRTSSRR